MSQFLQTAINVL